MFGLLFSSTALEDLPRVSIGTLTFEENPGRHLELCFHTYSDHGLQMVTPKSSPTFCFLLKTSVFSAASFSAPALQSPVHFFIPQGFFGADCVPHSGDNLDGTNSALVSLVPLAYIRVGIAGALLTKCRGAPRSSSWMDSTLVSFRCPGFFNPPFNSEPPELATKHSLEWVKRQSIPSVEYYPHLQSLMGQLSPPGDLAREAIGSCLPALLSAFTLKLSRCPRRI